MEFILNLKAALIFSLSFHAGIYFTFQNSGRKEINTAETIQIEWQQELNSISGLENIQNSGSAGAIDSASGSKDSASKPNHQGNSDADQAQASVNFNSLGLKKPEYPSAAKKLGQEGLARLRLEISAGGNLLKVTLLKSSGSDILDESLLDTARRYWKFPAQNKNYVLEPEFDFRLKEAR